MSELAAGFWFDKPREGAPEFVKGRISIQAEKALETITKFKNEKGYVNLDLLKSKEGKLYLSVNDWKPEQKDEIKAEDVPW
jgi:hypothetical protein